MALDKWADDVLINGLKKTKLVQLSRQKSSPGSSRSITLKPVRVVIDPLDGSSLIDVNLAVGTIIGIISGKVLDKGENMDSCDVYSLRAPYNAYINNRKWRA